MKIGNTGPYNGPASAYSAVAKSMAAYYKMTNEQGGVNGRKIIFISYDDAFTPPKTFEQVRKLVEEDGVLLIVGSLGTTANSAIHRYLNQKNVLQLFVASGATKWNDPKHFPWTMGCSCSNCSTSIAKPSTRAREPNLAVQQSSDRARLSLQ